MKTVKQRNEQGFAVIETVLVVVFALIAAFVAYYVYHTNTKATNTYNAANRTASTPATKLTHAAQPCKLDDKTVGVYEPLKTYEFCAPNGWQLLGSNGYFISYAADMHYNAQTPPVIPSDVGGDEPYEFSIGTIDASEVRMSTYQTSYQPLITPESKNGTSINGYVHTVGKNDHIGGGIADLPVGTKHYEYIVGGSGKQLIKVEYNKEPGQADNLPTVNNIVSSIKTK